MSTLMHPEGPEPERVYWVRRAVVIGGLVVLLAVAVAIATAVLRPSRTNAGTPVSIVTSTAPTTAATPSPKASATTATASPAAASPKPSTPATPSATAPTTPPDCTPSEIAVRVNGASRATIGGTTKLDLALLSTQTGRCRLDMKTFELRIYSGTDRIWSTADCASWRLQGILTMVQGKVYRFSSTWTTQRSAATCTLVGPELKPGTYVATAQVAGGTPAQHVMTLSY